MVELQFRPVSEIGVSVDFVPDPAPRLCACYRPNFHVPPLSPADSQIKFRARTHQYRARCIQIEHIWRRIQLSQTLVNIQRLIGARLYLRPAQYHLENVAVDYVLLGVTDPFLVCLLVSIGRSWGQWPFIFSTLRGICPCYIEIEFEPLFCLSYRCLAVAVGYHTIDNHVTFLLFVVAQKYIVGKVKFVVRIAEQVFSA